MEEMMLDLGADEVEVRDQAEKEITQEGDRILPLLRLATENEDPELKQRAKKLLLLMSAGIDDNSDPKLTQTLIDWSELRTEEEKHKFINAWFSKLDTKKDLTSSEFVPILRSFAGAKIDNGFISYYLQNQHFRLSCEALHGGDIDLLLNLNNPDFVSFIPDSPYCFGVLSQNFIENKTDFLKGLDEGKRGWYAVGGKDEALINQLAEDHPAKMYYQINTGQDAGFDAQSRLMKSCEGDEEVTLLALSTLECLKERRTGGIKQSEQKAIETIEKMKQLLNKNGKDKPISPCFYSVLGVQDDETQKRSDDLGGLHPTFYQSTSFRPELCGAGVDLSPEQILHRGETLGTELAGMLGKAMFRTQTHQLNTKIGDFIAVLREVKARIGVSGVKQVSDHLAQELLKAEAKDMRRDQDAPVMLTVAHIYTSLSRILVPLQQTNMMIQLLDSYFVLGGGDSQLYADEFARKLVGLEGVFAKSVDWQPVIAKFAPEANKWERYCLGFNLFGLTYDAQKNEEVFSRFEAFVSKEAKNEDLARVVAFIVAGKMASTGDYKACIPILEKVDAWQYLEGICFNYPLYLLGVCLTEHYVLTKDPKSLKHAKTLFAIAQGMEETNKVYLYCFQSKLLAAQGKREESIKALKMMEGYDVLGRQTQPGLVLFHAFLQNPDAIIYDNKSMYSKIIYVQDLMEKGEYQKAQRCIDAVFLNLVVASPNRAKPLNRDISILALEGMRAYSDVAQALLWHREAKTADAIAQLDVVFQRVKKTPKNLPYFFLQFVCKEKDLPQNKVKAWNAEAKILLHEQANLYAHDTFIKISLAAFAVATGEEIEAGRRILLAELKSKHDYNTTLQLTGLLAHLEEKAGNLELAKKYMKEYALMQPIYTNTENYFRVVKLLQKEK